MGYYPVFIQLQDRRCIVVGGGTIAEGKVRGLLAAGGNVTIVAPEFNPGLRQLEAEGRVRFIEREYRDGDLQGYELCMVATDDGAVNSTVAAEGKRLGVWVNASDDTPNCDFILPSVVRQGSIVLAASTGGGSPALARRLREELTDFLAEDYAGLAELLAAIRTDLRRRNLSPDSEAWARAIDARFRALVAQRRPDEARSYLLERLGVAAAIAAEG